MMKDSAFESFSEEALAILDFKKCGASATADGNQCRKKTVATPTKAKGGGGGGKASTKERASRAMKKLNAQDNAAFEKLKGLREAGKFGSEFQKAQAALKKIQDRKSRLAKAARNAGLGVGV